MPNIRTNEVYQLLQTQITDALKNRDALRQEQVDIDEKIEDINRVILALERSLRTLAPVANAPAKERSFREDDLDQDTAAALEILSRGAS